MIADNPLAIDPLAIDPLAIDLNSSAGPIERFNELFSVLEDLLKRIADTEDPDIRRKRAQVRVELIAIRSSTPHWLTALRGP